ncbi:LCP family protein [Streptococcus macacae]|uniref:Cell envelope-related transcriptional attenuator domain-containing protein n=1 Tax=Streptococcus macacae NCTC 11558 TaxID=764298 RepID=G5JUJ5_9STRE|nr:LCP family protein [Streptococcus macacae]EHJ51752.1 hypothetical protein STRMA_0823 [Streptococcus macacae NCTC 11558]SUN78636.1 transcriptional regulator [Streptococcus macacae NCTC 11558]
MVNGSTRSSKSSHSGKQKQLGLINGFFLLLFVILSAVTLFFIFSYQILDFRKLNIILAFVLLLIAGITGTLIIRKKAPKTTFAVLLLSSLAMAVGIYYLKSAVDTSNYMNNTAKYVETEMSVVAAKDSDVSKLSDLNSVLAPTDSDGSNIAALLSKIKSDKGLDLTTEEAESYQAAYQAVLQDKSKAMVLNSAYGELLSQSDDNYKSKLKTLYTFKIKQKVASANKKANSDVFNVYISGIDTYGSISSVSRSDVNIIMTVNRKTNKILLTTTPRDAYVPIADGGNNQKDKLTHAGIYGVDASIHTLEKLYDIDIDYYARINFTSFLKLVDLLGGIDIDNDQAFNSHIDHYDFPKGRLHLDSKKALAFVRERYSLEQGDNDRGKNQEKVISAIVDKLTSLNAVSNYNSIIKGLSKSIQTNMSLNTLMSLVNSQLESNSKYTVTSQALTGTGSTGELKSYAMPNSSLYMLSIDDSSLSKAKKAIKETMDGD